MSVTEFGAELAVIGTAGSVPATWDASWRLAQRIASTPFVPGTLRGRPEAVLACVLYGAELGLGPMQSLASIHVIDGRPAAAPELMRALIARHGHRLDVLESTDDKVTIHGRRADTGAEATVTWTMVDAQRAGLAGKGSWKSYPRAMLLARATSELARMIFADVVAGLSYTPEEVASIDGTVWSDPPPAEPEHHPELDVIDAELVDPVPDPDLDEAVATFDRLKALAGTPAAELVKEAALDAGRRLTVDDLRGHAAWRAEVLELLDAVELMPTEDPTTPATDAVQPREQPRTPLGSRSRRTASTSPPDNQHRTEKDPQQ